MADEKLTIDQILKDHDDSFTSTQDVREERAEDLIFARIPGGQWEDGISDVIADLEFRGQFDLLQQPRSRLAAEIRQNEVAVEFLARDEADEDFAEVLSGMFRQMINKVTSQEAINTGIDDQIDVGYGAFRVGTEYVSEFSEDNDQQQALTPIQEANNVVFWSPGSKRLDKSDAAWCTVIHPMSRNERIRWGKKMGISDEIGSQFPDPAESYAYPWFTDNSSEIYVGEHYRKHEYTEKIEIWVHGDGRKHVLKPGDFSANNQPFASRKSIDDVEESNQQIEQGQQASKADELKRLGFFKVAEKRQNKVRIKLYWCSGDRILKVVDIPGQNIPIIPIYGKHYVVEGSEFWVGIISFCKDPQRLHNYQWSANAEVSAKGFIEKPVWTHEQLAGHEYQWSQEYQGRYYTQNWALDGKELPLGPAAFIKPPEISQTAQIVAEFAAKSVADQVGPSISAEKMLSPNVTAEQVSLVSNMVSQQSWIYIDNFRLAMRRLAEVFASIAQEILDTERDVVMRAPDGKESEVKINQQEIDMETGKLYTINDAQAGRFEVSTKLGKSHQTQQDETRSELREIYDLIPPDDAEMKNLVLNQYLTLLPGTDAKLIADKARKRLLASGDLEPETAEDEEYLAQVAAQAQNTPPDPATILAQAEQAKADAEQMKAQANIAMAQIKEQQAQVEAAKVAAEIELTKAKVAETLTKTDGQGIENAKELLGAVDEGTDDPLSFIK